MSAKHNPLPTTPDEALERYAHEHASEFTERDALPLSDREVDALAEEWKRRRSPLFELCIEITRARAELRRHNPLQ